MSARPSNKVTAGMLAGALAGIIVWVAKAFGSTEVPVEVGMSITTVFTAIVQYLVPEAAATDDDNSKG